MSPPSRLHILLRVREFSEREKGTLEPGRLADIVVLSQDIFRIPFDDIPKTRLGYTIVGGRKI